MGYSNKNHEMETDLLFLSFSELSPVTNYPRSFHVGDVVWGESRGIASWPGKLVANPENNGSYGHVENGKVNNA